jgi:hypothetical protein
MQTIVRVWQEERESSSSSRTKGPEKEDKKVIKCDISSFLLHSLITEMFLQNDVVASRSGGDRKCSSYSCPSCFAPC